MTGTACCRNCLHMISRGSLEMDRGVLCRRTVHVCAVKRITLDDVGSDRICSRFEEESDGDSRADPCI